jgi:ribose/xylose/arabinose/galactoside ABC-type transport system permease subunit
MNRPSLKSNALRSVRPAAPQVMALILVLCADWLVSHQFFNIRLQSGRLFGSVIDVFYHGAPVALLAIGMSLVIATGGIDLSVGAIMAISGAFAAVLINSNVPLWETIALARALGGLCGLWNGFLVAIIRIQPIVATLILLVAGRGIAQLITGGQIVTFDDVHLIGVASSSLLAIPLPIVIAALVLLITIALVRWTALGLLIEATGANALSSRYAGVETRVVTVSVYVWSGLCAGMAGIIAAADIRGADANNVGLWTELDAILAVVLGGASLLGGRFGLVRSVIGALIIQAMNTGILLSGFQPEFNLIVKAVVVLVVLLLQSPAMLRGIRSMRRRVAS